ETPKPSWYIHPRWVQPCALPASQGQPELVVSRESGWTATRFTVKSDLAFCFERGTRVSAARITGMRIRCGEARKALLHAVGDASATGGGCMGLGVAVAVMAAGAEVAAEEARGPASFAEPSPPKYEIAFREAVIPMPDGVKLAADLYLPSGGPRSERFPVLLEYLPYRKNEARGRDYPLYSYFVRRGYAVARVDIRG